MLNQLIAKNPNLPIFSVDSEEFRTYGRVIKELDTTQIVEVASRIENPANGATYHPSEETLEKIPVAKEIGHCCFGTLPVQIGYCWGHNQMLNATEWHTSSEINIAVTPIVLLLAHLWEIEDGKLDSNCFRAFYVPKGMALEVFATTLHFTPCQVCPEGFGCIVAQPKGTNTDLEAPAEDPLLFRRNKWIIAHEKNQALLDRGVKPGITGCNYCVKY